jgi:hypothetical protein
MLNQDGSHLGFGFHQFSRTLRLIINQKFILWLQYKIVGIKKHHWRGAYATLSIAVVSIWLVAR